MLLVPCALSYVVGSRAVDRESRDLLRVPEQEALGLAGRMAERLHGRLASILLAENQRPFYHYQHRYPDLADDCECASWVESPLARGSPEPLIASYFEIDRSLTVTTPQIPTENADVAPLDEVIALRATLQSSVKELVQSVWGSTEPPAPDFSVAAAPRPSPTPPAGSRSSATLPASFVEYGAGGVYVEPFQWHTVTIDGEPRLVAMRDVRPPDARRVQGFLISTDAMNAAVETPSYDVLFSTTARENDIEETVGLGATDWKIVVSVDAATAEAKERSAELRRTFGRIFWGGTGIATFAAALVLGLVRQSEQLAKKRSQFAAAAAHELRTPLAGLRVYAEMLADDLGDPTKSRNYARQVASEAERLGRVVTNVLGFTRLEREGIEIRPEVGDLAEAVHASVDHLRPPLESLGASLEFEVVGAIPSMRFDADAVAQILQNLVDNAERYGRSARNRTIHVRLERASEKSVEVRVIDHGPGVAAKSHRRLFRPFTRGRDPDAPSGLGLGLTLVASLARLHGGNVRHESTPGGGATFVVSLPAQLG
jgi:signal transduction histidine kinase